MTWQVEILTFFTPKRESMLLAIDPDNLLRDDALLAEIQNRNYDVLELQDEAIFRNLFERNYRSRWDSGEARHVVIIVHTLEKERYIPYDLWKKGRRVELSVAELFPGLNAIVVRELDNAYYTKLFPAHQQLVARNELLRGERQTIEFILRVVFDLDPAASADPNRWVEFLIYKHYYARRLPRALETYLQENLLPGVAKAGLQPEFLNNSTVFYAWLGEQWEKFVALQIESENSPASITSIVNFADLRLRPLMGFLFTEGLVRRTALAPGYSLHGKEWLLVGISSPESITGKMVGENGYDEVLYNLNARLKRLQALDEGALPAGKTDLRDWLNLAAEWAEAIYIANRLPVEHYSQIQQDLARTRCALDLHFWAFIQSRYSAVDHYRDQKGPISVADINRWLYQFVRPDERLALVCLDGMALDGWFLLREFLASRRPGFCFEENRVYAAAPTITPVSRQALFAGRPPAAFAETIARTDQDSARWQAFWINHDIPAMRIAYAAVKVRDREMMAVKAIAEGKNLRLGVLVNLFDDVMHASVGMPAEADKRVLYDSLFSQLDNGYLDKLFWLLLDAGYRVFIASDHGGIAGVGNGIAPPKALVDEAARRVVLFDQQSLADDFAQEHGLRAFRTKSLPPELFPVYPTDNDLFTRQGITGISHGGLSLEELVVPFVEISMEKARPV